ncbi:NO-binding membrane sensor protein with MHYT domain [Pseudoduganella flava]|uniref:histidine kinase n=1 Tax=Pseudoduganella flava TaxID=871742 RepID=A0A562PH07_9BURK|nr:MHYT domain-containing protein [Pseudoduganella flava]QGZ42606.1 response regulator [Pseudoduganella flava]TWI43762.1 NO-binding membrane sensor protein with MHYT domain [Pseudoduganella flava]
MQSGDLSTYLGPYVGPSAGVYLGGHYHPGLVLVSILVAVFASYTGLSLADRVRSARGTAAAMWTAGGALALGIGIWAMHFIGMLAFQLPIPVGYDLGITALSLLLPVAVTGLALWQLRHRVVPTRRLVLAALLMGLGINGMHYTGMAAMRMRPGIVYDPVVFAVSLLLAIGASAGALWIAYRLRQRTPRATLIQGAAAVVMGLAIAGMHYTGMAAAAFPAGSVCLAAERGMDQVNLAVLVMLATAAVLTIALIVSVYDARLEARTHVLAASLATAEERRAQFIREHEARVQLERVAVLKDEFLATLSHELRTPLNAVLGWAQLLQQQGARDDATLRRGLAAIERNARAQAQMIDDLLDMSGIVSGKVQVDPAPAWPADFVTAAVEAIRPAALARRIVLGADIDRGAGPVLADAARMQQVMGNLLSNAVKFTEPGGRVGVTLAGHGDHVTIRVTDTGIGIEPGFLPHVFDRFRQADSSTTRRHGGLGLGLSIARQLVELQGGTIRADSAGTGHGATFTICLPVAAHARPPIPRERERSGAMPDLGGAVIVAADDQPDSLDVLRRALVGAHARVHTAGSGAAALELVARVRPALLISDISMPGMDGFELLRKVRALPGCEHLPALALTAFAGARERQRALDAGYTDHLPKPVGPAALVRAAAAALAQRAPV